MAKIILSGLVSDLRGKLGGAVAQVSPGGLVLRAPSARKTSRTPYQSRAGEILALSVADWQALDTEARTLWASIARAYSPDAAGVGLAVAKGRSDFIRWRSAFYETGAPLVSVLPASFPFDSLGLAAAVLTDPDPADGLLALALSAEPREVMLWARPAPYYPYLSGRGPWTRFFRSSAFPALVWTPGEYWSAALPRAAFDPLLPRPVPSYWEMRATVVTVAGTVARSDTGAAAVLA